MASPRRKQKDIPRSVLERSAAALRVLAHPDRLRLVELLAQSSFPVGDLAQRAQLAPHACSQHLNLMKAHGLVVSNRQGRETHYEIADPHAFSVLECIRKHL